MADLVFSLGGDISLFERALAQALTSSQASLSRMTSYFQTASRAIDAELGTNIAGTIEGITGGVGRLGSALGALKVAAGAFIAFEALKEAVSLVSEAADAASRKLQHLVDIGNEARNLGISTDFLQAFKADAQAIGLTADQAVAALTRARDALSNTLNEGEKGAAFSSTAGDRVHQNVLAGNLPAVSDAELANAASYQEKIRVILDLVEQLQQKGANIAAIDLADKVFGPEVANSLRQGLPVIEQIRTNMEGVARTSDDYLHTAEAISQAQAINAQILDQNNRLAAEWKDWNDQIERIQLDIKTDLTAIRGVYVEIVEQVNQWIAGLERIPSRIQAIATQIGNSSVFTNLVQLMDKAGLIDRSLVIPGKIPGVAGGASPFGDLSGYDPNGLSFPLIGPQPPRRPANLGDASRRLPPLSGGGASAAGAQTDEVDNLIKSLDKAAAAEKGEADAVGKSNEEKQKSVDLAKAEEAAKERGSALTADERTKVLAAADAYVAAKQKIDEYNASQKQAAEQAKFFGDTFEEAIDNAVLKGQSLQSVLKGVLQSLESSALKALITGEGPLAGLFGTAPKTGATGAATVGGLFGLLPHLFGFAEGGPIKGPGGPRSDGILARVSPGEYVVNADAAGRNLALLDAINSGRLPRYADGGLVASASRPVTSVTSGSGTQVAYTHAPTYNIMPAQGVTPEQLSGVLDAYDRKSRRNILSTINEAKQRRFG